MPKREHTAPGQLLDYFYSEEGAFFSNWAIEGETFVFNETAILSCPISSLRSREWQGISRS
jgi:hypothetical protein